MITSILFGILTSTLSEIVTAFNKKLYGTVLQGDAAFLIAFAMALVGGAVKVFYIDGQPLPNAYNYDALKALFPAFTQVWTVSQIYFLFVTSKLKLDVQPGTQPKD